jgi:hypothetical protein
MPDLMNRLHNLSEYPVLAELACVRTKASRLDGRACKMLYEQALQTIDLAAISPEELMLMRRLGVFDSELCLKVSETYESDAAREVDTEEKINRRVR